jgi:putative membrane protein
VVSQANLTAFTTACIALSGASVLAGWYLIRVRGSIDAHRRTMLAATVFAAVFLVGYVTRWSMYGSKPFDGTGLWRAFYVGTLLPHVLLAIVLGPLVLRLLWLALEKRDFVAHRRLARITLPIWLYVAASGWLIYYMLYGGMF